MAEERGNVAEQSAVFPPPKEFQKTAYIQSLDEYRERYERSIRDPEGYWGEVAEEFHWFKKWNQVRKWEEPWVEWFVGAETNLCYNCVDRHLNTERRHKAAIVFEGEPGDVRTLTYQQLHDEVCRVANVLKGLGLQKGDRVAVYMPMIPELAIVLLACARLGIIHSVIFGGFSAEAVRERVNDATCKAVITADGGWRRAKIVPLKETVDKALADGACPSVEKVLVFKRCGNDIPWTEGRDVWWHEAIAEASTDCPVEPLDAQHPAFILYTSGSTGKPKGVQHAVGGYMVYTAHTAKYIFDLKDTDLYWCTADIGWITGHSYIVYGPLANGATVFMYEGAPDTPNWGRFWEMIERHRITILYTAPTAIRAFIRQGNQWVTQHDLSSLRLLGTVGEPINPDAWLWYYRVVGKERCPIVDTWWQTETGGILISPLPGATPTKPGSATLPFFGVEPDVVDQDGKPVPTGEQGFLVIRQPWPGMMRTLWGDPDRYRQSYWEVIPHVYFTGDGAMRDRDGYFWILGRIDDVVNISGHRIGTAEVEHALVGHPAVAEAAVIGVPDELTGQALVCFVTLKSGYQKSDEIKGQLVEQVASVIGKFARPKEIRFTDALPKTRSGKIMRRLLRKVALRDPSLGNIDTLEDISVLAKLQADEE
ncbi:MAG: acetyl-coenzyme A synthetase [Candidatus Poribacteria bacterium]|nr:MAG: acetyl-coenzyme A synthetase [Candidatus Poribacteria bacterium]